MKELLVSILLISTGYIHSQPVAGKIYYRQILNLDPASVLKNTEGKRAILYFTDTLSYYVYNSTETMKGDRAGENDVVANNFNTVTSDYLGEVFMTNFKKKQIFVREFVWRKPYTTVDTLAKIDWILMGEQKYIGSFTCQKAKAFFRGRHFEAWFATKIPVSVGPWKLQGLPGLILEAYDDKNEVHYIFDGIEIPDKKIFSLKIPNNGKYVSVTDYRNLWKDETAKLKKFLEATAEKGTTIDVSIRYFPIEKTYQ